MIRAALLTDLALSGALTAVDDHLELDTDRTGFGPADQLLSAVSSRPDRPLVWWVHNAPIGFDDVADDLVGAGAMRREGVRRRLRDLRPALVDEDRRRVRAVIAGAGRDSDPADPDPADADPADPDPADADPADRVLACLLLVLPAAGEQDDASVPVLAERCGAATWLARELLTDLLVRKRALDAVSVQTSGVEVLQFLLP